MIDTTTSSIQLIFNLNFLNVTGKKSALNVTAVAILKDKKRRTKTQKREKIGAKGLGSRKQMPSVNPKDSNTIVMTGKIKIGGMT